MSEFSLGHMLQPTENTFDFRSRINRTPMYQEQAELTSAFKQLYINMTTIESEAESSNKNWIQEITQNARYQGDLKAYKAREREERDLQNRKKAFASSVLQSQQPLAVIIKQDQQQSEGNQQSSANQQHTPKQNSNNNSNNVISQDIPVNAAFKEQLQRVQTPTLFSLGANNSKDMSPPSVVGIEGGSAQRSDEDDLLWDRSARNQFQNEFAMPDSYNIQQLSPHNELDLINNQSPIPQDSRDRKNTFLETIIEDSPPQSERAILLGSQGGAGSENDSQIRRLEKELNIYAKEHEVPVQKSDRSNYSQQRILPDSSEFINIYQGKVADKKSVDQQQVGKVKIKGSNLKEFLEKSGQQQLLKAAQKQSSKNRALLATKPSQALSSGEVLASNSPYQEKYFSKVPYAKQHEKLKQFKEMSYYKTLNASPHNQSVAANSELEPISSSVSHDNHQKLKKQNLPSNNLRHALQVQRSLTPQYSARSERDTELGFFPYQKIYKNNNISNQAIPNQNNSILSQSNSEIIDAQAHKTNSVNSSAQQKLLSDKRSYQRRLFPHSEQASLVQENESQKQRISPSRGALNSAALSGTGNTTQFTFGGPFETLKNVAGATSESLNSKPKTSARKPSNNSDQTSNSSGSQNLIKIIVKDIKHLQQKMTQAKFDTLTPEQLKNRGTALNSSNVTSLAPQGVKNLLPAKEDGKKYSESSEDKKNSILDTDAPSSVLESHKKGINSVQSSANSQQQQSEPAIRLDKTASFKNFSLQELQKKEAEQRADKSMLKTFRSKEVSVSRDAVHRALSDSIKNKLQNMHKQRTQNTEDFTDNEIEDSEEEEEEVSIPEVVPEIRINLARFKKK